MKSVVFLLSLLFFFGCDNSTGSDNGNEAGVITVDLSGACSEISGNTAFWSVIDGSTSVIKHGKYTSLFPNGKKALEVVFVNGNKHGIETQWYENGIKYTEIPFVNGSKHGTEIRWHNNEVKKTEISFDNGKKHGTVVQWYDSGIKKAEISFVGDIEIDRVEWDEDGVIKDNIIYVVNNSVNMSLYINNIRHDIVQGASTQIGGLGAGRYPYGSKFPSTIVVGGVDEVLHMGSGLSGVVEFSSHGQAFYIEYIIGVEVEKGKPAKVDGNGDIITEAVPDKRKYVINAITSTGWVDSADDIE